MNPPILSVLVPTRERADTLFYTLQTLVSQEYEYLEIVVSDNASMDNTRDVVSSFNDSRIKYYQTDNRLGMSQNWEFGMSRVTGDYLTIIGDDDGFLPHAITDVSRLLMDTNTQALIWQKSAYDWPGIPGVPHRLSYSFGNELVEMNSRLLLWLIANSFTSYGRLPILYSGFVSTACINSVKRRSGGEFFHSNTPDVYSGIVLAHVMDKYLYSMRPFSINGGSRHSNGISTQKDATREAAKNFFVETRQPVHQEIPIIQGSIASYVAESYLQAFDQGLTRGISLNRNRYFRLIYRELLANEPDIRNAGLDKLEALSIPGNLARQIKEAGSPSFTTDVAGSTASPARQGNGREQTIDCDNFPVANIQDASIMLGNLLGAYVPPGSILGYSTMSLLFTAIGRVTNRVFTNYRLPF